VWKYYIPFLIALTFPSFLSYFLLITDEIEQFTDASLFTQIKEYLANPEAFAAAAPTEAAPAAEAEAAPAAKEEEKEDSDDDMVRPQLKTLFLIELFTGSFSNFRVSVCSTEREQGIIRPARASVLHTSGNILVPRNWPPHTLTE
jgi:60s Acidic ribosomal protein